MAAYYYRYGFQGQEQDNELKGKGNSVNYRFRMHDVRIGRFFAVDPLAWKYSYNSPYAFSENKTIQFVELEGLEVGPPLLGTNQVLYANPGVNSTQAEITEVSSQQANPQLPTMPGPLDLSTLTGTQSDMATQVLNHMTAATEAIIADPTSTFNTGGGIPTAALFSNVATSAFNINTPTAATLSTPGSTNDDPPGTSVMFSLNITGAAGEIFNLQYTNTTATAGGSNLDGSIAAPGMSDYSVSMGTNTGGFYSIRVSDPVAIGLANAQVLECQTYSSLNHGLILRDKITIWKDRRAPNSGLPDPYPTIPVGSAAMMTIPFGFRAANIPDATGAAITFGWPRLINSDGDFSR